MDESEREKLDALRAQSEEYHRKYALWKRASDEIELVRKELDDAKRALELICSTIRRSKREPIQVLELKRDKMERKIDAYNALINKHKDIRAEFGSDLPKSLVKGIDSNINNMLTILESERNTIVQNIRFIKAYPPEEFEAKKSQVAELEKRIGEMERSQPPFPDYPPIKNE